MTIIKGGGCEKNRHFSSLRSSRLDGETLQADRFDLSCHGERGPPSESRDGAGRLFVGQKTQHIVAAEGR